MTDFGLTGKLIKFLKGVHQSHDEKELRVQFVAIMSELQAKGANVYAPAFGSEEYWEPMEMVKRGWLHETHHGFMRVGLYNARTYSNSLY
jgi:hypothetical protein